MRYRFNEKDCARIEAWARKTNLHAILSFIESHSRDLEFPRRVLLGTNGGSDILIQGIAPRSTVSSIIRDLDEPFNPRCPYTLTYVLKKQPQDLSAEIDGTIASGLAKGFGKVCFLESTGKCERGIVRAHLIQEALLREFAVKGHVLQFNLFNQCTPKEGFRNWPQPVGVDRVSTFTGFCAFHDHQVFRPIEEGPFTPTPEALFLYAYRAFCASLYTCQYRFEMVKATYAAVQASQPNEGNQLKRDIATNDLNLRELIPIKEEWDRHLTARAFASFDHLVLSCPKTPDIVGAMFFAPPKNFQHRVAQWSKGRRTLDWVAFSVIPRKGGGGLVIISAKKGNQVWRDFTDSLITYPPEKRTMAVVNYILCYFGEQLILSPTWWDKLSNESQEAVVNAWSASYYPRYLKGLCDWGPFTPLSQVDIRRSIQGQAGPAR